MIVVTSWIWFVVPLDPTTARIALGITSFITEVTVLNMMNNSMPKVYKTVISDPSRLLFYLIVRINSFNMIKCIFTNSRQQHL